MKYKRLRKWWRSDKGRSFRKETAILVLQLLFISGLFIFVLENYEADIVNDTYTFETTISDVEYFSKHRLRWVCFDTVKGRAYYKIHTDSFLSRREIEHAVNTFEYLSDNNVVVNVCVSDKVEYLAIAENPHDLRVVAVSDAQNDYFSIDFYENDQNSSRRFFCIALISWAVLAVLYYAVMRFTA